MLRLYPDNEPRKCLVLPEAVTDLEGAYITETSASDGQWYRRME
ncbi:MULTISPECIES: hypothetical protein [unclassified Paenibacillus]|nr:hypothetical protein [Paenibacillus sp. VTT E-133280]